MARLEWTEAYATGIPALDHEHRRLIDVINSSCEAFGTSTDTEVVRNGLAALYDSACAHFALEERLLRDARHAGSALQKERHEVLLGTLRDIMDSFEDGRCGGCNRSLENCLVGWFDDHCKAEDGRGQHLQREP